MRKEVDHELQPTRGDPLVVVNRTTASALEFLPWLRPLWAHSRPSKP